MMAAGIFVFSAAALLQFFISYCRSLIAASAKQVLSPEVKDVTGIQRVASGEDFKRVMQLLQLCPECPEDRNSVQAIGTYFSLLNFVRFADLLQPGHARTANGRLIMAALASPPKHRCLFRHSPSSLSA